MSVPTYSKRFTDSTTSQSFQELFHSFDDTFFVTIEGKRGDGKVALALQVQKFLEDNFYFLRNVIWLQDDGKDVGLHLQLWSNTLCIVDEYKFRESTLVQLYQDIEKFSQELRARGISYIVINEQNIVQDNNIDITHTLHTIPSRYFHFSWLNKTFYLDCDLSFQDQTKIHHFVTQSQSFSKL